MGTANPKAFFRAFTKDWVTLMSGGVSVALAAWASSLPTDLPSWAFWAAAALCFVYASYRIWLQEHTRVNQEHTRVNELQDKLKQFEEAKPRIRVLDAYVELKPIGSPNGSISAHVHCATVRFTNEPPHAVAGVVARGVVATIVYYDDEGKQINSVTGQWGGFSSSNIDLIDFPISMPRALSIAIKHQNEDCCYGFHQRSYHREGWRDEALPLPGAKHIIAVTLEGEWVNEIFFFVLENLGKENSLTLSPRFIHDKSRVGKSRWERELLFPEQG